MSVRYGVRGPAMGLPDSVPSDGLVPSRGRMRKWVTANETACPTIK